MTDPRLYPSARNPRGASQPEVLGVGDGYAVARGEVTLDGSNPTVIATGLDTVVAFACLEKKATSPGDDPIGFSCDYGGSVADGSVELYAWKTDGTDPTWVASTNSSAVISWIAVGTIS